VRGQKEKIIEIYVGCDVLASGKCCSKCLPENNGAEWGILPASPYLRRRG